MEIFIFSKSKVKVVTNFKKYNCYEYYENDGKIKLHKHFLQVYKFST